jgi:ketosteroid isomerase-like protein
MDAAQAQDFEALRELWTDDCVIIPPQGPIQRGIDSMNPEESARQVEQNNIEILEYIEEFEEVEILGDHAYEWGIIRGKMRVNGGEIQESVYRLMRILKKVDGEWKVHRSIWTGDIS